MLMSQGWENIPSECLKTCVLAVRGSLQFQDFNQWMCSNWNVFFAKVSVGRFCLTFSKLFVYKETVSLGPKTSPDRGFISGSVLINKHFYVDTSYEAASSRYHGYHQFCDLLCLFRAPALTVHPLLCVSSPLCFPSGWGIGF